jgi:eukaryotic-like serine/threonine-protein kinase
VPDFRISLALCYINIGQIERKARRPGEALHAFERARVIRDTLQPTGPDSLYDGACLWSQISELADPGLSGRSAADRAMRLLREAVAAGFRDRAHMDKDSDLDPLRSRPDFRLLMLDLAFPPDPFKR